eukprot:gb/GECG01003060.1/.p1 GENE.gb/GECG01003060.1/~~gb/GECG01003060.1/.p1  ORF type:complete len:194 (+),score=15.38 gb/GECG01003060.1/:1-582(+)
MNSPLNSIVVPGKVLTSWAASKPASSPRESQLIPSACGDFECECTPSCSSVMTVTSIESSFRSLDAGNSKTQPFGLGCEGNITYIAYTSCGISADSKLLGRTSRGNTAPGRGKPSAAKGCTSNDVANPCDPSTSLQEEAHVQDFEISKKNNPGKRRTLFCRSLLQGLMCNSSINVETMKKVRMVRVHRRVRVD